MTAATTPTAPGLHYLDPRHGEPCPGPNRLNDEPCPADCPTCHGTGKRGGDAEGVIRVQQNDAGRWFFILEGRTDAGEYPTEADALFAARCALAVVEVREAEDGRWYAMVRGPQCRRPHPTRDAALIAALDAKGGER